ncbi:MAG TPA: serine hydrolase domain-containing protein [Chloroflexia bacterium]
MSSAGAMWSDLEGISDHDFRMLGERVVEGMARLGVPGVAAGVISGDEEYTAGFGVTSITNPLPVDSDTLFQIGSTTKTVTGTIAMRLVEQGRLDLDVPVRSYLPELRLADEDVASRATLRHLFTHTGGWVGDYFDDFGMGEDALTRIVARLADLPQLTPLGEVWSYNNAGFYIAGRIIEVVTGQPYEHVARELVLGPLGMDMSFFFPSEVITYRVAIGHNNPYVDGKFLTKIARPYALPRTSGAVGNIISTVKDQLRYARFHMGDGTAEDGTRLLSPESMRLMQTPHVAAADGQMFGITWFMRDMDGTWVLRHGGATNGQMSAFMFVPSRRFAITVLTNADRGRELHQEITTWALEHYLGLKPHEPEPLERDDQQLASYAGLYTGPMVDLDLQLRDGSLVVQDVPKVGLPGAELQPPGPPLRLAFSGEDLVTVLDEPMKGAHGEFLRGPGGEVRWFRISGRVFGRTGKK